MWPFKGPHGPLHGHMALQRAMWPFKVAQCPLNSHVAVSRFFQQENISQDGPFS